MIKCYAVFYVIDFTVFSEEQFMLSMNLVNESFESLFQSKQSFSEMYLATVCFMHFNLV